MIHEFICTQCGLQKVYKSEGSTGYAVDKDGNKVCYDCCGINDARQLKELPIGGKMLLYMDTVAMKLTNWPGTLSLTIRRVKQGWHNKAGKRYDTWFDYYGNEYHAVQYGDNTQIAHVYRIKPIH